MEDTMAIHAQNERPDRMDAHRGWVELAFADHVGRTRALIIGWVAVHRVYGPPDADGWCRGLYRLTHMPTGRAICDVADNSIHRPYGIATLFVRELPDAPASPSPEAVRLGQLVAECAVPWMVMLPQDDYASAAWPAEVSS
jgi:hypothetical protein